MRLERPRIAPLGEEEMTAEQRAILEGAGFAGKLNILKTLVRYPVMLRAFLSWGNHVLGTSTLDPVLRELAILRVGYRSRSGYEFFQHADIAMRVGVSAEAVERVKAGPGAAGWTDEERAVLAATDQLYERQFIDDAGWEALAFLGDEGRTELVFAVGQYQMVSMVLNTLGVQVEEGKAVDPSLRG
jgi:alkylhydroperoxidase family enzyme